MIESSNLKETTDDSPTRQQLEDTIIRRKKNNKFKSPSSDHPNNSSSWLGLKDPRIVRVSRAFGGKDRHSKVCTVRGLRDRRVRLSVPTAIQLYDLQDRLGLNQPSKVVDWLLNVAKDEIDHLPPLSIPPGCFSFDHQMMMSQPDNIKLATSCGHAEDEDGGEEEIEEDDNNDDQQWLNNSSSSSVVVPFGTANYDHHHLEPHTNFGFTQHDDDDHHKYLEDNFKFVQLPPTLSLSSSSSATHQILVPSNHQDQLHPRTISDHHHHLQMFSSASQTNNGNIPPFFAPHQSPRPNFQLNR